MNGQTSEHRKQAINTILQKFVGGGRIAQRKAYSLHWIEAKCFQTFCLWNGWCSHNINKRETWLSRFPLVITIHEHFKGNKVKTGY